MASEELDRMTKPIISTKKRRSETVDRSKRKMTCEGHGDDQNLFASYDILQQDGS